jgi:hypothetical protein
MRHELWPIRRSWPAFAIRGCWDEGPPLGRRAWSGPPADVFVSRVPTTTVPAGGSKRLLEPRCTLRRPYRRPERSSTEELEEAVDLVEGAIVNEGAARSPGHDPSHAPCSARTRRRRRQQRPSPRLQPTRPSQADSWRQARSRSSSCSGMASRQPSTRTSGGRTLRLACVVREDGRDPVDMSEWVAFKCRFSRSRPRALPRISVSAPADQDGIRPTRCVACAP